MSADRDPLEAALADLWRVMRAQVDPVLERIAYRLSRRLS